MVLHGRLCGRVGRRRNSFIPKGSTEYSGWAFWLSPQPETPQEYSSSALFLLLSKMTWVTALPVPIYEHGSYHEVFLPLMGVSIWFIYLRRS